MTKQWLGLSHPAIECVGWNTLTECKGGRAQCAGVVVRLDRAWDAKARRSRPAVRITPITSKDDPATFASLEIPVESVPDLIRALEYAIAGELGREAIQMASTTVIEEMK
jgi:hypothetical protein